jgi:hypothetical protein
VLNADIHVSGQPPAVVSVQTAALDAPEQLLGEPVAQPGQALRFLFDVLRG